MEIVKEEIESDHSVPGDLKTAKKILKEVGNSMWPFIKVSVDCQILAENLN